MPFEWNPAGAFSLVAMAVVLTLGVLVFRTRPHRSENRAVAAALLLGATANGTYFGLRLMSPDSATAYSALAVGMTLLILLPPAYALVVSTIPSPMVGWLRSRWGLGLLATYVVAVAFPVAFYVAEYTGGELLLGEVDSFWLGLFGAAALTVVFIPLQGFAERVADTLMPGTVESEEYVRVRKQDVYREAAEAVLLDPTIRAAEREMLDRLRRRLGLDPEAAAHIEQAASAAMVRSAE